MRFPRLYVNEIELSIATQRSGNADGKNTLLGVLSLSARSS